MERVEDSKRDRRESQLLLNQGHIFTDLLAHQDQQAFLAFLASQGPQDPAETPVTWVLRDVQACLVLMGYQVLPAHC